MKALEGLYTQEQVAELFGVTVRTIHRWVHQGDFPAPIRIHRRWVRWTPKQINAFLDSKSMESNKSTDSTLLN